MDAPKRYETTKHAIAVASFILDVAVLLYLIKSGSSIRIRQFAEMISTSRWIVTPAYTFIFITLFKLVDLPFSFYSGYKLEHRFGLSRQTLGSWIKDKLKSFAIGAVFAIATV